jgi:hypothetical protein
VARISRFRKPLRGRRCGHYLTVLSWADYSYVMPVGAFGYAMMTLLAVIFLHERG